MLFIRVQEFLKKDPHGKSRRGGMDEEPARNIALIFTPLLSLYLSLYIHHNYLNFTY